MEQTNDAKTRNRLLKKIKTYFDDRVEDNRVRLDFDITHNGEIIHFDDMYQTTNSSFDRTSDSFEFSFFYSGPLQTSILWRTSNMDSDVLDSIVKMLFAQPLQPLQPPIGLMPKKFHERRSKMERLIEVCGAISRYYNAGKKINIEWVNEYNELVEDLQKSN